MIPARLKLENFMCFSKIELDFSSIKVACLTGKNGSGKSSLLDAFTWVLWERARAKSDKLVKLGTQKMSVELELISEDKRYKIIRYYQKGSLNNPRKSIKENLELFYFDDERKTWQPYTAKNLSETQERITNIIKLDYEAFVNSIYLRQNNTSSFITKSPQERKKALAEILGLEQYVDLANLSKQKIEELELKAKLIKEQINESEIKQFSLKKLKNEKEELLSQINFLQEQLTVLYKEKREQEAKNGQIRILSEQNNLYKGIKQKYENDIRLLKTNINTLEESINHFDSVVSLEEAIKQRYDNYLEIKQKLKELDIKEVEYHTLKDRLLDIGSRKILSRFGAKEEYNKINQSIEEKLKQLDYYNKILSGSNKIKKKYESYQNLRLKMDYLNNLQLELNDLEIKILKLQNVVDRFSLEYHNRIECLQNYIKEIEEKLPQKPVITEKIALLEAEVKQYNKYEAELERIREKGIEHRDVVIDKNNKNAFLELELDKLKARINQLQSVSNNVKCPTCAGNVLNPDDLVKKIEFDIDNIMIQMESNNNDISISEDEIKFYRIAYKEKKKYISKRSSLIFELAELRTDLNNIQLEEQKLQEYTEELNNLQNKIADKDYAKDERENLNRLNCRKEEIIEQLKEYELVKSRLQDLINIEKSYKELDEAKETVQRIEAELPYFTMSKRTLEKELNIDGNESYNTLSEDIYERIMSLDYNINNHIKLREQLSSSQDVEYDYLNLQLAYQQKPMLEKNLKQFEKTLSSYNLELEKLEAISQDLVEKSGEWSDLSRTFEMTNDTIKSLSVTLNNCNCQLAVVNDRIKQIEDSIQIVKDKRREIERINKDIQEYADLAKAFGEKGMQDIILENSIPEIEAEANKILNKLSDNHMRVYLKTTKANKTGDNCDWLDIYISDKHGTRNYELYSGGEAFRINFAIRIALSKLLAKSRNVKLQTLIIDEGFGSQDLEGQEKLFELIKAIKEDFDMILVVSHVENFADYFTSRIELSRRAGASIIQVVA